MGRVASGAMEGRLTRLTKGGMFRDGPALVVLRAMSRSISSSSEKVSNGFERSDAARRGGVVAPYINDSN